MVVGDEVLTPETEEDDSLSLEGDPIIESSSLSVASESSSVCGDDFITDFTSDFGTNSTEIEKCVSGVNFVDRAADFGESNVDADMINEPLAVATSLEEDTAVRSGPKCTTVVLHQLPLEKGVGGTSVRSVFELECTPLWGFTSVCGKRSEMEDAVAIVPRFLKIPIQLLIGNRVIDGMNKCFSQQTTHFFGVYDGHGGSQVKFCFQCNSCGC
jgi:protein phosphatase 2C